ncbi:taste receptor type 1 member 3 isoform X2 [Phacochoerus africanus]|uniref:taste receptor type 1 member 3 isoform X2 n=1 Tax=Phacochoerus africanus TaxID=41426 RepID=UPI001FD9E66F|nr:taste receptor type 1 member 3 isoform X2 [Phacochoerus africanus]
MYVNASLQGPLEAVIRVMAFSKINSTYRSGCCPRGQRVGCARRLSRQSVNHGDMRPARPVSGAPPASERALAWTSRSTSLPRCHRFSSLGLLWALAMMMAVEEINNGSALLPGLRLGYDLFDTCSEPMVAMKPSLVFMAKAGSRSIATYCDYTQYQPRVLAVIGPHMSEVALVTGKFFGFFLMPQVSYSASTDRLSNRETFPSFFRTVPSDRVQAVAMVELLQELRWNWVAAMGSDDEYGRQGLSLFSSLANTKGICIAHEGLVPLPHARSPRLDCTQGLLPQVNQSSVQVVVLFSSARAARSLFSHSLHCRLSPKVWVASEAWLTSDLVMTLPGMDQVGTVLGFLHQGALMPEFSAYVQTRLALAADPAYCASLAAERQGLEEHVVGPRCPQCDHVTLESLSEGLLHHRSFPAYAAVYSVAQALHDTLLCNASGCPTREPVRPWQLLENMYNLSFRARGLTLRFDTSGNVDMDYDLKLWVWQDLMPTLRTVGTFDGRLTLQRPQMRWHTPGNKEPVSQCSRQCEEGQVRRVKGFHSCCYDCVDCKAGSYQRNPGEPPLGLPPPWGGSPEGRRPGFEARTPDRGEVGEASTPQHPLSPPAPQMTPSVSSVTRTSGPRTGAPGVSPAGPASWLGGSQPCWCCSCCWAWLWAWCWQPWGSSSGTETARWFRPAVGQGPASAWPAWASSA